MAKITVIHGNAADHGQSADLILTDPPFDMPGKQLARVLNQYQCDHLVLITSMKQLIELLQHSEWQLAFDFVLDAVTPKKSKNIRSPNYTHATGAYLTRNKAKSIFNRKLQQRSDTFDNSGYWPTIIRAPRERLGDHGMAKSVTAITDILGSFEAVNVVDMFAGSGTTGWAAFELDMPCTLIELNEQHARQLQKEFGFLG